MMTPNFKDNRRLNQHRWGRNNVVAAGRIDCGLDTYARVELLGSIGYCYTKARVVEIIMGKARQLKVLLSE